jgi:Ricin-type beta-trefoil lectin domain
MRKIGRIVAVSVSTSVLALGGLVGGTSTAHATSSTQVTSCLHDWGPQLWLGITPNCTSTGTVDYPAQITIDLNPGGALTSVLTPIIKNLGGLKAIYTLACSVDGTTVTANGSYTVNAVGTPTTTTLSLQKLVGSPVPNKCTITVTDTTINYVTNLAAMSTFNIQDNVTAVTTYPGALWQKAGTTPSQAEAAICADDVNDGDVGTVVAAFTCFSDLSDYWSATGTGQFVHNGVCLTNSGNVASLQACSPGDLSQYWTAGTYKSEIVNRGASPGTACLTAPSHANGARLALTRCTGAADQIWTAPEATLGTGS